MKLRNLRVTVPYKHNRSNVENVEYDVTAPVAPWERAILSSNHLEWKMPRLTSFPHSMHQPAPPPPPCLATSTSVAFCVTLWFSDLVPNVLILKTFHVKIF